MPPDHPQPETNIPCVILAGGQSRRFGSNKALAALQGRRLIDLLIARLRSQTSGPIVINASSDHEYDLPTYRFISDQISGEIGPLSGLHAALVWAEQHGFEEVATSPVDTPILPKDFIDRLQRCGSPAIAVSQGRQHVLHGIWPVTLKPELEHAIETGVRAAREWCALAGANACHFPATGDRDPFFNVNTREDLSRLEEL